MVELLYGGCVMKVVTDIATRWSEDMDHHPESIKLMEELKAVDKLNDYAAGEMTDTGGDGDLGELLMFLMDIVFEQRELVAPGGIEPPFHRRSQNARTCK